VADQRLADDRSGPGHKVEHAAGQAGVVDDLGEDVGVERRDLRRLQHDGAAGGEGVGDLRRDLVQRVVPRRDGADDTDRLLHDEAVAEGLLVGVVLADGGGRREGVDRQAGLDEQAQPLRHACFLGHDRGDLVHSGAESLGDAAAVLGPLLRGGLRPPVERGTGGAGGLVDVVGGPVGDRADHRAVGRVVDVDRPAAGGRHPRAVDVELVGLHCSPWA
jgi:hypothetical protein